MGVPRTQAKDCRYVRLKAYFVREVKVLSKYMLSGLKPTATASP